MPQSKALNLLREHVPTISVGILTADLMNLDSELRMLEEIGIRVIHFDVMDGRFAPFLTVGPPFIKGVRTSLLKDAHLMIENPREHVEEYVLAGADIITVHVDTGDDIHSLLRELGGMKNNNDPERGLIRGAAINPDTPLEVLEPLLDDVEMISVLAVNPRVKGFPFFDAIGQRFARVREMTSAAGKDILLCIDGGIKLANIPEIAGLGADVVISGSAIFDGKAPAENARFMLNTVRSHFNQEQP
jgi:ribulose-phosphate 3-epimerase